ncbi:MAG: AAA family ATPase [Parcubacteria group bacterium]|nr:AAA family ATPase [Parcubacteria group bacterium]
MPMLPRFRNEREIIECFSVDDTVFLVFEGGPCAGKTTGFCYLQEKLSNLGFTVFIFSETPTNLINAGIRPEANGFDFDTFEHIVFEETLAKEVNFRRYVRHSSAKRKVVLCDRGFMDILAYTKPAFFEALVREFGLSIPHIRDLPYHAAFHLVTAALGAEAFYTLANNTARRETLEEARTQDAKTLEAWIGHPHLRVIDNSTDFEGKLKRLFQEVCRVLGIPVPLEIERKYLIDPSFEPEQLPVPFVRVDIEQMYLSGGATGNEGRIRRRGQNGASVYYRTHKWELPGTFARAETEKHISSETYGELAQLRDPGFAVVQKDRYCFVWQGQYFELDRFHGPAPGLLLLEIELTEENSAVSLPPFFAGAKDVTGNKMYSNYEIARIRI